ncbi:MAG: GPI anchored serine-threonine rich family protein [Chloroflexi bacterium]|nr:GPI anchored serine-threonine rich family protein [Chloroflexota bacterium]
MKNRRERIEDVLEIGTAILGLIVLFYLLIGFYVWFISGFTPGNDVTIEISESGEKFQIGDEGTITIVLLNQTSENINPRVSIGLPTNFLGGFIVDFPDSCTLNQGVMGIGQKISCGEVVLRPNEPLTINITIMPYQEGNYGGDIVVSATFFRNLLLFERKTTVSLNIRVTP